MTRAEEHLVDLLQYISEEIEDDAEYAKTLKILEFTDEEILKYSPREVRNYGTDD